MPEGNHVEMSYNFKRDCRNITTHVKRPFFKGGCMPFDTGNLANNATYGIFLNNNLYCLTISDFIAPYAYYLNTGTTPHDIPNSFNKGPEFGIGGKFNGKFHPGSRKWVGFVDDDSRDNTIIGYALNYFERNYGAKIYKTKGSRHGF